MSPTVKFTTPEKSSQDLYDHIKKHLLANKEAQENSGDGQGITSRQKVNYYGIETEENCCDRSMSHLLDDLATFFQQPPIDNLDTAIDYLLEKLRTTLRQAIFYNIVTTGSSNAVIEDTFNYEEYHKGLNRNPIRPASERNTRQTIQGTFISASLTPDLIKQLFGSLRTLDSWIQKHAKNSKKCPTWFKAITSLLSFESHIQFKVKSSTLNHVNCKTSGQQHIDSDVIEFSNHVIDYDYMLADPAYRVLLLESDMALKPPVTRDYINLYTRDKQNIVSFTRDLFDGITAPMKPMLGFFRSKHPDIEKFLKQTEKNLSDIRDRKTALDFMTSTIESLFVLQDKLCRTRSSEETNFEKQIRTSILMFRSKLIEKYHGPVDDYSFIATLFDRGNETRQKANLPTSKQPIANASTTRIFQAQPKSALQVNIEAILKQHIEVVPTRHPRDYWQRHRAITSAQTDKQLIERTQEFCQFTTRYRGNKYFEQLRVELQAKISPPMPTEDNKPTQSPIAGTVSLAAREVDSTDFAKASPGA